MRFVRVGRPSSVHRHLGERALSYNMRTLVLSPGAGREALDEPPPATPICYSLPCPSPAGFAIMPAAQLQLRPLLLPISTCMPLSPVPVPVSQPPQQASGTNALDVLAIVAGKKAAVEGPEAGAPPARSPLTEPGMQMLPQTQQQSMQQAEQQGKPPPPPPPHAPQQPSMQQAEQQGMPPPPPPPHAPPTEPRVCWGSVLSGRPCLSGSYSLRGQSHFFRHFCAACQENGVRVPASRVRMLPNPPPLANNTANGVRSYHTRGKRRAQVDLDGGFRVVNQTKRCKGPPCVILESLGCSWLDSIEAAPLPSEWTFLRSGVAEVHLILWQSTLKIPMLQFETPQPTTSDGIASTPPTQQEHRSEPADAQVEARALEKVEARALEKAEPARTEASAAQAAEEAQVAAATTALEEANAAQAEATAVQLAAMTALEEANAAQAKAKAAQYAAMTALEEANVALRGADSAVEREKLALEEMVSAAEERRAAAAAVQPSTRVPNQATALTQPG